MNLFLFSLSADDFPVPDPNTDENIQPETQFIARLYSTVCTRVSMSKKGDTVNF